MNASEMKIIIDREIGADTEATRLEFLKYVDYGRRLEREEQGTISVEDSNKLIADRSVEILAAVNEILDTADSKAAVVEANDEDLVFEEIKKSSGDGPIKAEMIEKFDKLLTTVDEKHTAIFHERRAALIALSAKYLGAK